MMHILVLAASINENRKKLEKEAVKVKGKYKKSKNMVLQVVKPEAFTFTKPQE